MQSLRKLKPGTGLALQEVTLPRAPSAGEVLIQIKSAGVCGTDLHIDEWTASYHFLTSALPVTVGHEFSGIVAALGRVSRIWRQASWWQCDPRWSVAAVKRAWPIVPTAASHGAALV